jgi:sodium-dependent dicarboxylate transporter 2/3/5
VIKNPHAQHRIKLWIGLVLSLLVLLLPVSAFPLENLSVIEQRVIAIFVFAALFWILEPIPIYATSILIIVLELVLISDSGFVAFQGEGVVQTELLSHKEIMATMASPIILLFLGGFFLALAATKYRLDVNLARVLLRPFGDQPRWVMLGLMVITALFSMFMSNTATTAMMLSILVPVLKAFPKHDRGRTGLALSIPVAANLGGIGTPIGTPPNAIALKYLTGAEGISFGQWMVFGVPFVVVTLLLSWVLLLWYFPFETRKVNLAIKGKFLQTPKAKVVYLTFVVTIFLWLFDFLHGMNAYIVAMIPVGIFLSFGIINKEDLKKLSWDVLWLVSGGIALGLALDKSGLASHVIAAIPFADFSPYLVLVGAAAIGLLMANFMSNTASANLLLPLLASLGVSMPNLDQIGGSTLLILAVTMAVSLGMALPISTPPNALAHATGVIQTKDLAKQGISVGLVGLVIVFVTIYLLRITTFI